MGGGYPWPGEGEPHQTARRGSARGHFLLAAASPVDPAHAGCSSSPKWAGVRGGWPVAQDSGQLGPPSALGLGALETPIWCSGVGSARASWAEQRGRWPRCRARGSGKDWREEGEGLEEGHSLGKKGWRPASPDGWFTCHPWSQMVFEFQKFQNLSCI